VFVDPLTDATNCFAVPEIMLVEAGEIEIETEVVGGVTVDAVTMR
jgi:hypothetical protein